MQVNGTKNCLREFALFDAFLQFRRLFISVAVSSVQELYGPNGTRHLLAFGLSYVM